MKIISTNKVRIQKHSEKLAVFDLDETLIHTLNDDEIDSEEEDASYDFKIQYEDAEGVETIYLNIRPYLLEWIKLVKQYYQVVLFTASTQEYADSVLDHIDPDRSLFKTRLYRTSWLETEDEVYIKDLRIFEDHWKLKDIVLIDNSAHSFGLQLNNGIPILSYYNGKSDKELAEVAKLLQQLFFKDDVRVKLRSMFWIQKLKQYGFNDNIFESVRVEEVETPTKNAKKVKLASTTPNETKNDDLLEADANRIPMFKSKRNTIKNLSQPWLKTIQSKDNESMLDSLLTKIDKLDK